MKFKINVQTRMAVKSNGTKIPVVDATEDHLVTPSDEDAKNGVPGDPTMCMYALAFKRMHLSELVFIVRRVAYVELKAKGGKPVLVRYILKRPARLNAKLYDSGARPHPEGVIFAAPRGKERLDVQHAQYEKRKALVKGSIKGKSGASPRKPARRRTDTLREKGTGRFHFAREPLKEPFETSV